jgi:hypothetical protein
MNEYGKLVECAVACKTEVLGDEAYFSAAVRYRSYMGCRSNELGLPW